MEPGPVAGVVVPGGVDVDVGADGVPGSVPGQVGMVIGCAAAVGVGDLSDLATTNLVVETPRLRPVGRAACRLDRRTRSTDGPKSVGCCPSTQTCWL